MLSDHGNLDILVQDIDSDDDLDGGDSDQQQIMDSLGEHDFGILKMTREEAEEFFKITNSERDGAFIFR